MQTNNHKLVDYDAVLDAKFGAEGTPERARAEEEAYAFYSGQILLDARKEAKVTQAELAERTQTTKSYISKIENGVITPSVGVFYRIIAALGLRVEVVKPIYWLENNEPFFLIKNNQESQLSVKVKYLVSLS